MTSSLSLKDWFKAHRDDHLIPEVIAHLKNGTKPASSTFGMEKKQHGEKSKGRGLSHASVAQRPCKEHSFLTDVADVRVMEQGLLQLLEDFHSGKLQAFGGTDMYDKMNEIREKQEQLAQLHFDLDLQQDMRRMASEEARARNYENINKMIGKLHGLSTSIQQLQRNHSYDGQKEK